MQQLITWWCHLIGITDEAAIQMAVGIVGGSSLVLVVLVVLYLAVGLFVLLKL